MESGTKRGGRLQAPASTLIPATQALGALREFHQRRGHRPENIAWQQT